MDLSIRSNSLMAPGNQPIPRGCFRALKKRKRKPKKNKTADLESLVEERPFVDEAPKLPPVEIAQEQNVLPSTVDEGYRRPYTPSDVFVDFADQAERGNPAVIPVEESRDQRRTIREWENSNLHEDVIIHPNICPLCWTCLSSYNPLSVWPPTWI